MSDSESATALARRVLDALSRGDLMAFSALLHPEVEIITVRGIRRGVDEAEDWAQKRYEHLERRYAIDELCESGDAVLAVVRTQYVWSDSGLVGDESPAVIELEFDDGKLRRWRFREDLASNPANRGSQISS
jgi:ketosteroid isomerase-like protein